MYIIFVYIIVMLRREKKLYEEKLNSARTAPAGAVVVYDHTRLKVG